MLSIQNVSKQYKSKTLAVADFSLDLTAGVVGLLGPNGAGKTTLLQMIAGITRPTSGCILFKGKDIAREPGELRARLGYLPQDFGVYDNLTAFEFLSYFGALKGVRSHARVMEMLELVNLHSVANKAAGTFSGGMRQRLGNAQALINNPDILIVDEPTAGLDPEERVRFRNILSDIGVGRLVVLSTHIVSDIESIASSIAVMKHGRLVTHAASEDLLKAASGSVWNAVVSVADLDAMRKTMHIAGAVKTGDRVSVRIVSQQQPLPTAVSAEPNLEDTFIYLMNFNGQAHA
jgi:ABC-type multidrug transport system ATPase subunit